MCRDAYEDMPLKAAPKQKEQERPEADVTRVPTNGRDWSGTDSCFGIPDERADLWRGLVNGSDQA